MHRTDGSNSLRVGVFSVPFSMPVNSNRAPPSELSVRWTSQPCASATCLTMLSPNPFYSLWWSSLFSNTDSRSRSGILRSGCYRPPHRRTRRCTRHHEPMRGTRILCVAPVARPSSIAASTVGCRRHDRLAR